MTTFDFKSVELILQAWRKLRNAGDRTAIEYRDIYLTWNDAEQRAWINSILKGDFGDAPFARRLHAEYVKMRLLG